MVAFLLQSQTNQKTKIPNGTEKMNRDFHTVSSNTGTGDLNQQVAGSKNTSNITLFNYYIICRTPCPRVS